LLRKEITKLIHLRLRKKKAQRKIGRRCALIDGLGLEKLCHTMLP
jgi:hypothetical protein